MLNANNPLGPGLVIGIPFCGRPIMPEWALAMISMNYPLNTSIQYVTQRGTETGIARNNVVKQALEVGAKYVWFIDDDVAPPYYALRKLMYELDQRSSPMGDAGVIGGIYCAKCDPPTPLVYDKLGSGTFWNWKVGDVFEVGAIGTGCMLIRTDVFRNMKEPWFRTVDECPDPLLGSTETRLQMSDDLYFCKKVTEAGYKIFAHGGVLCIHWDVPTQKGYILPEGCYPLRKKSGVSDIPGWMSEEELEWLYAKASQYKSVVEIGSWLGRSTYALLSGCPGTVWAVDHFKGTPSELGSFHALAKTQDIHAGFLSNVGHFPNLKVLKMDSIEASKQFEEKSVEMVFVDGDHTFEAFSADLKAWLPKCSKFICGHDTQAEGVFEALKALGIKWQKGPGLLWYVELT